MEGNKKSFTISDDRMFCSVLSQNKELAKLLVETVLGFEIGDVVYINSQQVMHYEADMRSMRFDVYLEDSYDDAFDIEMENTRDPNKLSILPVRSDAYAAAAFTEKYQKGTKYEDVKNTYVIFLCLHDPFGMGLAKYECIKTFKDDRTAEVRDIFPAIFCNCEAIVWNVGDELKSLLRYLAGKPHDKTRLTERLQNAVNRYNKNERWRKWAMTFGEQLEEAKEEGIALGKIEGKIEGITQGALQSQNSIAEKMIRKGYPDGEILELADQLKPENLQELRRKILQN